MILSKTTTANQLGCNVFQNSFVHTLAHLLPLLPQLAWLPPCGHYKPLSCLLTSDIWLFVAYLKRGGGWHHGFIIWVIIRVPEFIGFLPLHIRTSMEAQASSWISTQQCDIMNKISVVTEKRMLENRCSTLVWTPEVTISLQMFVIHAQPSKGRILSEKHKQKISVSTSTASVQNSLDYTSACHQDSLRAEQLNSPWVLFSPYKLQVYSQTYESLTLR